MQGIVPHLWFDTEAKDASTFYTSLLDNSEVTDVTTIHDAPSGDCDIVSFTLAGQPFQAISAGPLFTFNPSISFRIDCDTKEEVDELWAKLSPNGQTLMELDSYPWSARYGWLADRYGLTWQIMHNDDPVGQKVVPTLMFVGDVAGKAEDAMRQYTSVIGGEIGDVQRHTGKDGPDAAGTIAFAPFTLAGYQLAAMDSAADHKFGFNEAVSLMVYCDTQDEIDRIFGALSAVPESEQCGWLKDRFGVSWQIVPARMDEMMQNATDEQRDRVTQSFLQMKKLDIATLEKAYAGA